MKARCISCHKVGLFDVMHNGDTACCYCGKISKDHDMIYFTTTNYTENNNK